MLKELHIRNFKSIEDLSMNIRELNILIGPNNSGKTSVLHSLALLRQSTENGAIASPNVNLRGRLVNLGDFEDVVYRHDLRRAIRISFWLSLTKREPQRSIIRDLQKTPLLGDLQLNRIHCLITISRARDRAPFLLRSSMRDSRGKHIFDVSSDGEWEVTPKLKDFRGQYRGFLPYPTSGPTRLLHAWQRFLNLILEEFSSFLYYLSSSRGTIQRSESLDTRYSHRPKDIGLSGENTIPVLAYIKDDERYGEVMEKINFWSEQFGLKKVVAHLVEGPAYSLKVTNKRTRVQSNVLDIGFGVNQLLPVIVQCFYAPRTSLIMIEQPEAHLHPRSQADVADFLVDVVNFGNRVIVETHSEHLLLRLQRRVAEKKISPKKINICYFEETPKGTKKSDMNINEMGYFVEPIPEGFFEEGFHEALAHLRASYPRRDEIEQKD